MMETPKRQNNLPPSMPTAVIGVSAGDIGRGFQFMHDAETGVIGAMIQDPERVIPLFREVGGKADWFTGGALIVAMTILDLWGEKKPVDLLTVEAALHDAKRSELIPAVESAYDHATPSYAEHYCDTLRDRWFTDQAKRAIMEVGRLVDDPAHDTRTVLGQAQERIARLMDSTAPRKKTARETETTVADWMEIPDEPDRPIVGGLFDVGDRVAVVGQSKARKSFLALQLALAIASGRPFLGFGVTAQSVLLVNGEITRNKYKQRVRRMVEAMVIEAGRVGNLVVKNAVDEKEVNFETILEAAIRHGSEVVIIDPAYLLLGDECDQRDAKEAVNRMKAFTRAGITLVLVYHAAKGQIGDRQGIDRIAGSGVYSRDASTMISLVEHASEPDHVVMSLITRNYPPQESRVIRFEAGAFHEADGIAAIEKTSTTRTARVFTDAEVSGCFSDRPFSYAAAIDAVKRQCGVGINKAKELIAKAQSDGLVTTEVYGRSTLYKLNSEAENDSV